MKKTVFCLMLTVLAAFESRAQREVDSALAVDSVRSEKNLKTGNSLDVLTSFFQLALQDLGGDNQSFAFKSTLFGIKARADTSLLVAPSFRKQRPARNTQFEVAVRTTNNFRFAGISGGVLYALVNHRDKARIDMRGTEAETYLVDYQALMSRAHSQYAKDIRAKYGDIVNDEVAAKEFFKELHVADSFKDVFDHTGDENILPEALRKYYMEEKIGQVRTASRDAFEKAMDAWAKRGLLTAGLYGRTDSASSHFREARFETIYLKGAGTRWVEADLRAILTCKDTTSPDKGLRYGLRFVGGANIVALHSHKTQKSLLELKPNLEFASILSKQYAGEENFWAINLDVRIRITDKIWIPFIVKYDIKKSNFLGFLNVSANLDVFKNMLKS